MKSLLSKIHRLAQSAWFAYLALALLQMKVVWRIWDYKDLTTGDTSSYFRSAFIWFEQFRSNLLWSPLYTGFYGSLLHVTDDIYTVTILHRIIIVFAVSLLVLAVMRKLLPHTIAWLVAAWWAILPINFNTLYEVHLFSAILPLAACWVALASDRMINRGIAVAILFASSLFVRNELAASTLLLGLSLTAWEIYRSGLLKGGWGKDKLHDTWQWLKQGYLKAYGLPVFIAAGLFGLLSLRSQYDFASISAQMKGGKHALNVCQIYAFGYQQRNPDWTLSPWTQCYGLMEETFGKPLISLSEAFQVNSQAILEHFSWNLRLVPSGLQIALFNAASGSVNPDYAPASLDAKWVILPTCIAIAVVLAGAVLVARNLPDWWTLTEAKVPGWLVLLSVSAVAIFIVIPMQRPRPSYLFILTILIMAIVGTALSVLCGKWASSKPLVTAMPLIMALAIFFVPSYYHPSDRPLLSFYDRLLPFQDLLSESNAVLLSVGYGHELCSYLGGSSPCNSLTYQDVFPRDQRQDPSVPDALKENDVTLFYAHQNLLASFENIPDAKYFLDNPESFGWSLLAEQRTPVNWKLYKKDSSSPVSSLK